CIGSPSSPTPVSEAAVDTGSEITTTDLQEKEVVEQAENGRDAAAIGNANEENREQETDNEVDEQEEEGGEEEEEEEEGDAEEEDGDEDGETESVTGKRAAEDDEDDDVDIKKQKTHRDDQTAEKENKLTNIIQMKTYHKNDDFNKGNVTLTNQTVANTLFFTMRLLLVSTSGFIQATDESLKPCMQESYMIDS
ncbi:prothymosin alpha-like, partial [Rhinopithecus roxellana]|uniref:prothymosin alpha-like n=1 Tax=Rhinopithecus roxellana TaxID=61622 RepID=UPI0012375B8D